MAVGPAGEPRSLDRVEAAGERGLAHDDLVVADLDARRPECRPVAAQPPGDDVFGAARRVLGPLDRDDQDVAMAEADEMLGRRHGTTLVVDIDGRQLLEVIGVDGRHRQAGPPDLGDLRVVGRQPDGDDPVDRRPGDGPR